MLCGGRTLVICPTLFGFLHAIPTFISRTVLCVDINTRVITVKTRNITCSVTSVSKKCYLTLQVKHIALNSHLTSWKIHTSRKSSQNYDLNASGNALKIPECVLSRYLQAPTANTHLPIVHDNAHKQSVYLA